MAAAGRFLRRETFVAAEGALLLVSVFAKEDGGRKKREMHADVLRTVLPFDVELESSRFQARFQTFLAVRAGEVFDGKNRFAQSLRHFFRVLEGIRPSSKILRVTGLLL